jgi:hypothetical protein
VSVEEEVASRRRKRSAGRLAIRDATAQASSGQEARGKDSTMREPTEEAWRTELMSRESNGITVALLWCRATNLATIAVTDTANAEYFELVLAEDEPALEAFRHPYAHAAARGLEFRTHRPELETLRDAA